MKQKRGIFRRKTYLKSNATLLTSKSANFTAPLATRLYCIPLDAADQLKFCRFAGQTHSTTFKECFSLQSIPITIHKTLTVYQVKRYNCINLKSQIYEGCSLRIAIFSYPPSYLLLSSNPKKERFTEVYCNM